MTINKVSQSISQLTPQFVRDNYPLFERVLEYYYKSQEKTGYGQNILNEFLNYLDIDKLNVDILDGATTVVSNVSKLDDTIIVENVDGFLENDGTILVDDEVIFYEKSVSSPSIALSPGISYDQVKLKWKYLTNQINSFDGLTRRFPLVSQENPISPPSPQHLIVKVYGETLIPGVDFTISGSDIVYTVAPRTRRTADDTISTSIIYLDGFVENTIVSIDNISGAFDSTKKTFQTTVAGEVYQPVVDEYVYAIYDTRLLVPKVDYTFDGSRITLSFAPLTGKRLTLFSIEAPIPSFGNGAVGFSRVDDEGRISSVEVSEFGQNYRSEYPPKITIKSDVGSDASVRPLINGVKSIQLLDGGKGYSDTNPPLVQIEDPTTDGGVSAVFTATVVDGSVTNLDIESSGNGYTFTPRVTFVQPGGAKIGPINIVNGQVAGPVEVIDGGSGYTTAPEIYIDEPTGENGIKAALFAVIQDGVVASITIGNAGQGYENTPRAAIIDPTGAQVLETKVDGDGRVIDIEILSGGSGYDEIPSVYIVDQRIDGQGNYSGGTGATAVASIFNGQITDINITNFGEGYSADNPPVVFIQSPPQAKASVAVGLGEVTGFQVINSGSGYEKCRFEGCARGVSAITSYTEDGNAVFTKDTTVTSHSEGTSIKCLDSLFIKRLLDKYVDQYLPDVPQLDYKSIDVRNAIKSIKTFYSTKGTAFSISYLFKLLYGEDVTISYPKDQIIKPSAATWSVNTILRATLVSGDPVNIQDALIVQEGDLADPNVGDASALVENFISIKTSTVEIFELILSEETIDGTFTVPYKTKLAEPLTETTDIITVDSTIGWPERNGEFVIGGTETVRYKEKSLNQFIECTRGVSGQAQSWDSATEITSNFKVYLNKGTTQEVVMNIVGIVDAQQTNLTDTGSYYLPGDKLTISKLGGTSEAPQLDTWLYNVKKLIEVTSITFGGVNDQSATVTCSAPHGLLVGDQVTVYGANPIVYNGTFLVTSRDSETVFQYQLPQPALVTPQGNILISVDLNKGKSDNDAIRNTISPYTTNVQNSFFNEKYVYVASTGIPNYSIGPFLGSALLPGNQRKLNRFELNPTTISTKTLVKPGPIGTWVNGVSIWSYKSPLSETFGAITSISIDSPGEKYDAASPPAISISGGGGTGATASVVVNGSISSIEVQDGGSGYTTSPLVSIVGGNGSGASATAIITKGVVSRILINDGGTGYTSQPEITIVGGGGSGASATASVRGPIKEVNIDTPGSSYTSTPSVTLSSGSGAVAQAIVSAGRIVSIAIISAGSGYTTAPEVTIQGDGFGAVARAVIDIDGENAGRVTSIQIINRGIGYTQGSTVINLNSVGQGARFSANVFQWVYNLQSSVAFDSAKGSVFEGYNTQYGGEYAHLSNPQRLRYLLGDNLAQNPSNGQIYEQETQLEHSPILGWAFDGNPIYGPYAYQDPTNQSSNIIRMRSSYSLKTELVYDDITNPYPSRTDGPLVSDNAAGSFVEDYEYIFNSGDLDQYNGRFCKTPDFPEGRYCYFVTIDGTEDGNPVFPYVLGPSYNSVVDSWNLSSTATQQNIPQGVVRYRDPYENVDIDVERTPNASTNTLSTEAGDILLFEVEDENRDGVISQDEIDDPEQILEESPLQLFDYFPKVRFDSKVDIEVETISKFEDASVTGFTIENAGQNYQVNDRLIFDNTDTDGAGVSARVSRISGEEISSYGFETVDGESYGVLQTSVQHNILAGDSIFVDYTPLMENTNKTFVVRQYKGIEEVVINQIGTGYNEDIPPQITIVGDGEEAKIEAVVSNIGSISSFNIINSGRGYTENPRVILSHPQIFKKAEYFVTDISAPDDYVKINDVFVTTSKESYICGKTTNSLGDTVGFVSKLSVTGSVVWQKTLESTAPSSGTTYLEYTNLYVDGNDVWVVGNNRPNSTILDSYNPDVIVSKYTQSENGLDASLTFQKAYAGISGSTRLDTVTTIKKLTTNRFIIGGYTNTNSASPYDAFLAVLDASGNFVVKRKLSSSAESEKVTDINIAEDGTVFFTLETASTYTSSNVNVCIGNATVTNVGIDVNWINEISNTNYSFLDSSISVDEFNEYYVSCTLRSKANQNRDSFWVGKFKSNGAIIWNYRYLAPATNINLCQKSKVDIFGDLTIGYSFVDSTTDETNSSTVKIKYDGTILKHTRNKFITSSRSNTENSIEGFSASTLDVDVSGDIYLYGQSKWNRNELVVPFTTDTTDLTGHYTLNATGAGDSYLIENGVAKIFGYQTGQSSVWENTYFSLSDTQTGDKLSGDWTIEFFLYKDSTTTNTLSQTVQTLIGIGGAQDVTGGLWLGYDVSGGALQLVVTNNTTRLDAGSAVSSTSTTMFADNTWQAIGITKEGNTFKVYVNGIEVITGTVADTAFSDKTLYFGNQIGWGPTATDFASTYQGQYYIDHLRVRNRAVVPTVPSDITALPTSGAFGISYDWTDDDWFTDALNVYDYIDYNAIAVKVDKNSDSDRVAAFGLLSNTDISLTRESITPVVGSAITVSSAGYSLGPAGLQTLDFNDATTTHSQNTVTLTDLKDIWSSRTATIPSPGSQKVRVTAVVKDRYFFKVTDTVKIDNVQELTLNQPFRFTTGSKLVLNNDAGSFVNSGYIIRIGADNKIYLAVNNNDWSNDLNTGQLSTERFDEQSTYGIRGPIPNDINEIESYTFAQVVNTTPGTFDIDLADYDAPAEVGGTNNLDQYAKLKPFDVDEYRVRIDEVSSVTTSPFIVGSVVALSSGDVSYNADYSTIQITNLTGVTKISLITNLTKIMQVTAVANSDEVYVITGSKHYLSEGEVIFVDGNPSQEVNNVVYDEYDGAFYVDQVISVKEFTYKLDSVAITSPATSAGSVSIFAKSPTIKMYYGHQYIFDMSHSSLVGANLSFSKDSLYKLEYSFNSIEREGTPGIVGGGQPTPTIKFKVDRDVVTNISFYFDPSRTGADSPVIPNSYLDVVTSPYVGNFEITSTSGATITTGDNTMRFKLLNEPEGNADVTYAKYSTSSEKAVGSIADIRIVNSGGFYTKLPVVTNVASSRKIERVQINEPGTEYAPGQYNSVPIAGDGEGGLVAITVQDTTDDEGTTIPGQITKVVVTTPGKGYTTASIDVASIPGILGPGVTGSGAELEVVIPPFGTGASIFTKGDTVGKIKKLKNNNFGYDYPHDYTLRPEITFPINAQLTSTSILDSITVTNPGSGYSQPPAVVITGGGGSGATAESTIQNGRLDQIIVKDPGAGYSSTPTVELKSSFNYIVNLDLGLLQFAFPHGIENGAEVTLNVTDIGDGAEFPLAAGALGRLNSSTTYYAIAGTEQSLEDDQLRLAITAQNAELGDAITFANAGLGRQQLLTSSFGGAAEANVITATFLEGELVYQGPSLENATATGYVSTNSGWQVGPRILKIVNYTGTFYENQNITGVVSKASGLVTSLKIAKGVLEIGSITKTTGQFVDDVGKPSEIIQKIQDSYYYQDFSYAINSSISVSEWKDAVIKNVHPASFKVFGQLNLSESGRIPNKETDFEITRSVSIAREATVPNIQNFALVEPIYQDFNNTEVLFRQKRLTSSENILTSVVQRLDDISDLFDGERIQFPLTIDGENVIANANQLMIVLNGVVQTPEVSFEVQNDSIVFSEPPSPPANVKYVNVGIEQIQTKTLSFTTDVEGNVLTSGIFPSVGNTIVGITSTARMTVTSVVGSEINGFITEGSFVLGEVVQVGATGFSATLDAVTDVENLGLFVFGETVRNFDGDTAKVESINLERGQETPIAKLRYSVGAATTSFEVVPSTGDAAPLPANTFTVNGNYQFGSEIFTVNSVVDGVESTTLTVTRGQSGTRSTGQLQDTPIYGTAIEVTNALTLSKTAGTYQSTPGLYDIQLDDVIIASQSGVVARITSTATYQDPETGEFIGQVNISDGSSFFGFLFNRITSTTYPNVVLDDISQSQISVVNYDDNATAFDSRFPANELVNNYIVKTTNESGAFTEGEFIRNYKIEYGNESVDPQNDESAEVRKLTYKSPVGSGFFSAGQIIRSENSKAEVIGFNQARKTIYLGKLGRSQSTGADYHEATFNGDAQLDTAQKRFGTASLLLDGTGDYLSIPTSTEFGFGTADFTIECWIRPADVTGAKAILDFRTTGTELSSYLYLDAANIKYFVNGSAVITGTETLAADTWYHIAISRSGTDTKLFVNGAQDGSTWTDSSDYGSTKPLRIGTTIADSDGFNGHIDEVRVSTSARYTAAFTAPVGIFQGDADTKLLLHLDGADAQTYTEDWSGVANWTNGDEFMNDAILATTLANSGSVPAGFAGKSFRYVDASNLLLANKNFLAEEVVAQLITQYPLLTIPGGNSNCVDDVRDVIEELVEDLRNGSNSHMWDAAALYVDRTANPITISHVETEIDETIWAYNKLADLAKLVINNQTVTVTGSHGLTQTVDNTITDSNDDSNSAYTTGDCADVQQTIDNLIDILTDTLTNANLGTPVDHLATVTRVTPAYEFLGATADATYEIPFTISDVESTENIVYTNRIDTSSRSRFFDAANLIRLNRSAIVDKAAYDLIQRYPSLALSMPRNTDGSGSGTLRCKTDLGLILDNLAKDIEVGGNFNTITAIKSYLGQNDEIVHIRLQLLQSLYAHTRLGYYMKQAINGDLDSTNTDALIVGDWGITNDPGGCANVQTAIDTLIDLANDTLAPTGHRFRDAGDLLFFNKDYIADEAVNILDNDFTYTLNGVDYQGFSYPDGVNGRDRCKVDIKLLLDSVISDLQTGGNSNTVRASEFYISSSNGIEFVEDQLLATIYAFEQVRFLGKKAINNLLYDEGETVTGDQYAALYTEETAYRDATITDSNGDSTYTAADCANVISAFETLIDLIIDTLTPAGEAGRSAGRVVLFNKNYYEEELTQLVNSQWGSGSWVYDDFLDSVVDNVIHDYLITDVSSGNTQVARRITLQREGVIDQINFTAGSDYQTAPTVTIDAPGAGGVQATAEAVLNKDPLLTGFTINTTGSGYTAPPIIGFSGGTGFTDHGATATLNAGGVSAIQYDGLTYRLATGYGFSLQLGNGVSIVANGAGTGSSGGFNVGTSYAFFGAQTGSDRFASLGSGIDTTDIDVVRVYAIAGSGSNGGDAPDNNENLVLQYSTDGMTWFDIETLIYGGTVNGGARNSTNFTTLQPIDVTLLSQHKTSSTFFRVFQNAFNTPTLDQYGVTKICFLDNQKVFDGTSLTFADSDAQSGATVAPSVSINTDAFISAINITNAGSGYNPTSPPSGTLSGGLPITAGTITNITAVLDTTRFTEGQTVVSSGGGTALVLEDTGNALFIGPITGTVFADGDTLTQSTVTATIPVGGVGSTFDWYTNVANVETLAALRAIESTISGQIASTNLFTNSEDLTVNWTGLNSTISADQDLSPDNQVTADKILDDTTANNFHYVYRDYQVSAFETYDGDVITYDSDTTTFDEGTTDISQTYTYSVFLKSGELNQVRFEYALDPTGTNTRAFFDLNLTTGVSDAIFVDDGLTVDDYGAVPIGGGWYRVYITATFSFGFATVRSLIRLRDTNGAQVFTGTGARGVYAWGQKFAKGALDPYQAISGEIFYSDVDYNIKNYILDNLENYLEGALDQNLTSPSAEASFYAYTNATLASNYTTDPALRAFRYTLNLYREQLKDTNYYTNIPSVSGLVAATKTYGTRNIPIPLGGGISQADFFYALSSNAYAEVQSVSENSGKVVKSYKRFRIDGDITDGPFTMNETVQKQGDNTVTGVVYGFFEDENFKYLDVEVTAGTWALLDTIEGSENGTTAQLNAIENRVQVIDLLGNFDNGVEFVGYTSGSTCDVSDFLKNEAAVLTNTGGRLTVDTETLSGSFEKTSVIYPENSREYVDVLRTAGLDAAVGARINSNGYIRLGISITNSLNTFAVGNRLYKLIGGAVADQNNYGIITEIDLANNFIYISPVNGTLGNGDDVGDFGAVDYPLGRATVTTKVTVAGAASAIIQDIKPQGVYNRLFLANTIGTFTGRDTVVSEDGYTAAVISLVDIVGRVRRSFRGFDGTQTTFKLTTNNGDPYFPDPAGHIMVFVNGILQPPGASNAYTAFSDEIAFTEPPTIGSSFNGFYVGKMRQLDDISFDFDSLRQSFNLKRNGVFYSLTLTEGVQSSTIRPENNIIVSLNGVIQEPGVGFELVGSRIIFSEIPRVGSTFVAFSYIGSEADVDAAEVVPPIEPGDFIDIQGETEDREVAVIESSNSLITFDYLGSVFGNGAVGQATLLNGSLENVSVTAPGSGYTSRPNVRVDSISGFGAEIKALVGVAGVNVGASGSGYVQPNIIVETEVPDDWTPPNLADYGEEVIDPEIL